MTRQVLFLFLESAKSSSIIQLKKLTINGHAIYAEKQRSKRYPSSSTLDERRAKTASFFLNLKNKPVRPNQARYPEIIIGILIPIDIKKTAKTPVHKALSVKARIRTRIAPGQGYNPVKNKAPSPIFPDFPAPEPLVNNSFKEKALKMRATRINPIYENPSRYRASVSVFPEIAPATPRNISIMTTEEPPCKNERINPVARGSQKRDFFAKKSEKTTVFLCPGPKACTKPYKKAIPKIPEKIAPEAPFLLT